MIRLPFTVLGSQFCVPLLSYPLKNGTKWPLSYKSIGAHTYLRKGGLSSSCFYFAKIVHLYSLPPHTQAAWFIQISTAANFSPNSRLAEKPESSLHVKEIWISISRGIFFFLVVATKYDLPLREKKLQALLSFLANPQHRPPCVPMDCSNINTS